MADTRNRVFLCYVHEDRGFVLSLRQRLAAMGVDAWIDTEDLAPGETWAHKIEREIGTTDAIVVCVSKAALARESFFHQEVRFALQRAGRLPPGSVIVLPLLLEEDCPLYPSLQEIHHGKIWEEGWFDRLLRALERTDEGLSETEEAEQLMERILADDAVLDRLPWLYKGPHAALGGEIREMRAERARHRPSLTQEDLVEVHTWLKSVRAPQSRFRPEDLLESTWLFLRNLDVTDITLVGRLTHLEELHLNGCPVEDLTPVAFLVNLKQLDLEGCARISDLRPLSGLKHLELLSLWNTPVADLRPLSSCASLRELYLAKTPVEDLRPLSGLHALEVLDLHRSAVLDLSPLVNLTRLRELDITGTSVQREHFERMRRLLPDCEILRGTASFEAAS